MPLRAVSMIDQQEPQYAPLPPIIGGVEWPAVLVVITRIQVHDQTQRGCPQSGTSPASRVNVTKPRITAG